MLFFSLVGGGIGSIIVTSTFFNVLEEKGFFYGAGLFLFGYVLIGIPIAGFTGLTYALLRLASKSVSDCSWFKRFCFGTLSWILILTLFILDGYFSEFDRLTGPISYAFFNAATTPKAIFLLVCILTSIYLHSLAEKAFLFFGAPRSGVK